MNTREAVQSLPEYVNVPLAELVESSTNPRKTFDDERLEELAESIRSKGVLSPLLARKVNGHFEIVSGARRYRAAQRAGLQEVPVRIVAPNDEEALETQIIENIQRADVHPFEEAQGFRALLEREGAGYTVEKIAARTGKAAAHIAKRLRLLDLIPPVADAFTAGHIGIEHALLIAKLGADVQEEALRRCFDGYYAANDAERSLVPVSRLQAWIEQNVYLSLKSVPFSKDDETLVPEAGSCANCPKRTGFNTLLFSEVREDSCADAACFNRKLDAHIAQRVSEDAESSADFGELQNNWRDADSRQAQLRRSRNSQRQETRRSEARRKALCPPDPGHSRGRHRQGPSGESLCGPDLQGALRGTATGRKTAAPMEGRKDRRKPKGETDARVPAPPSGRRA